MPEADIDLVSLFNAVTKVLKGNQASLNEADSYNHDHGDNMVKNFRVITKALKQKQGAPPSEQLSYASDLLSKSSKTGSAQLYAQGLTQAATQLEGQRSINAQNAIGLVQALMGSQQPAQATQPTQAVPNDMMGQLLGSLLSGGAPASQAPQPAEAQPADMLGGLMGTLLGGGAPASQPPQPAQSQEGDLLGGLMGALLGGGAPTPQTPQPAQPQETDMLGGLMGTLLGGGTAPSQTAPGDQAGSGINLGTLLTAGMAYMQAKQQGASSLEALVKAILAGSQMSTTPHHAQSSNLVTSTLLSSLGTMLGGKGS